MCIDGFIMVNGTKKGICKDFGKSICHPLNIDGDVFMCKSKCWPSNRVGDFEPVVNCGGDIKKCDIPDKLIKNVINGKIRRINNAKDKIDDWEKEIDNLILLLEQNKRS